MGVGRFGGGGGFLLLKISFSWEILDESDKFGILYLP